MQPGDGDTWTGLTERPLPVGAACDWAVVPRCGAMVCFSGVARDHAAGRSGVTQLTYEAYDAQVVPRLDAIAAEARRRWPDLGRLALLHRTGDLAIGDAAVLVVASAPHRAEAFDAARFCIDTLKRTVPIWKKEAHDGGVDWGLDGAEIEAVT